MGKNCQRHVWLLTGTGEGPLFAESLIKKGWLVTVSVVTRTAADSYLSLPLQDLLVGSLNEDNSIKKIIEMARSKNNGFDWVIDLTHPFASIITASLERICKELDQPYIRYERSVEETSNAILIENVRDLSRFNLHGQSILIALGIKELRDAIKVIKAHGGKPFARILPTPESLRKALASSINENDLAMFYPSSNRDFNLEASLCKKWSITGVLCRQSGGLTEGIWRNVSKRNGLNLWMIKRPCVPKNILIGNTLEDIYSLIGSA